tara:strand:+ start:2583 stop:2867 length:285 start_codon:yes stop_codon:yes gene_type:complete
MDILKENRICSNPIGMTTRSKQRYMTAPIPRTESIYKLSKLKDVGKPKIIKEEDVFNFTNKKEKKRELVKEKKSKAFDVKTDNKQTGIKLKYVR